MVGDSSTAVLGVESSPLQASMISKDNTAAANTHAIVIFFFPML